MKKVVKKKAPARAPKKTGTVIAEIRKKVENKLARGVEKASVGDYIKLVALEKEMEGSDSTGGLEVTWVEESEK